VFLRNSWLVGYSICAMRTVYRPSICRPARQISGILKLRERAAANKRFDNPAISKFHRHLAMSPVDHDVKCFASQCVAPQHRRARREPDISSMDIFPLTILLRTSPVGNRCVYSGHKWPFNDNWLPDLEIAAKSNGEHSFQRRQQRTKNNGCNLITSYSLFEICLQV